MVWFWIGFFGLVALLLFLDLFVLHKGNQEQSIKSAAWWTVAWMALGLSFSGVVYCIYEYGWLGAKLANQPLCNTGGDAAVTYVSAYLLEQALSIDNIFAIAMVFAAFRVPLKYQHRVLFWGIIGAVVFRLFMLGGGAYLAHKFDWIFYVFGGYLAFTGAKMFKHDEDEQKDVNSFWSVRILRRFVRIVDGDHGGKFQVVLDGRKALTTVAVCLIVIELTDVVFALDSIPAVLSVSSETFVMVTSNIFAIMGLRSLYFVLAGAMKEFDYLKYALGVLLVLIGAKMVAHNWIHISHLWSLAAIAGIIAIGVIASIVAKKREAAGEADAPPESPN